MKTDYPKLAAEIQKELLAMIRNKDSRIVALDYWDTKMGECEELDPEFNETKLRKMLDSSYMSLN